MVCLITYVIGFALFIPHLISIGVSLRMVQLGYFVQNFAGMIVDISHKTKTNFFSEVVVFSFCELFSWFVAAAGLVWYFGTYCAYNGGGITCSKTYIVGVSTFSFEINCNLLDLC